MSEEFVNGFTKNKAPSFTVDIYVAGDYDRARDVCRAWTFQVSRCVSVSPVDYVYTGGEEKGVRVTLVNYPRFPKAHPPEEITAEAVDLGNRIALVLQQWSYLVVGPTWSEWYTRKPDHETKKPAGVIGG